MSAEIKLKGKNGKGLSAIVDNFTDEKILRISWFLTKSGYANGWYKDRLVYLHCLIKPHPEGKVTDHINGNKLDCRGENLRVCTRHQNNFNKFKRIGRTSKYKGVYWQDLISKWRARIQFNYKMYHIGVFKNEIEAAKAYNLKAQELFGEFANLNLV